MAPHESFGYPEEAAEMVERVESAYEEEGNDAFVAELERIHEHLHELGRLMDDTNGIADEEGWLAALAGIEGMIARERAWQDGPPRGADSLSLGREIDDLLAKLSEDDAQRLRHAIHHRELTAFAERPRRYEYIVSVSFPVRLSEPIDLLPAAVKERAARVGIGRVDMARPTVGAVREIVARSS